MALESDYVLLEDRIANAAYQDVSTLPIILSNPSDFASLLLIGQD